MGTLPQQTRLDIIDSAGEALPKEKAVADYSVAKDEFTFANKLNTDTAIPGKYLYTNTDALTNDANSSYSQPISVIRYDVITIIGRNATNSNVRFLNSVGGLLKPVNDDGSEFKNGYRMQIH